MFEECILEGFWRFYNIETDMAYAEDIPYCLGPLWPFAVMDVFCIEIFDEGWL